VTSFTQDVMFIMPFLLKQVHNITMTVTNGSFVKEGITYEHEVVTQQPSYGPTSGLGPLRELLETMLVPYNSCMPKRNRRGLLHAPCLPGGVTLAET
jgi:hypothetical protein